MVSKELYHFLRNLTLLDLIMAISSNVHCKMTNLLMRFIGFYMKMNIHVDNFHIFSHILKRIFKLFYRFHKLESSPSAVVFRCLSSSNTMRQLVSFDLVPIRPYAVSSI